jgi:3-methyladenine DNA glycosylase AlkD
MVTQECIARLDGRLEALAIERSRTFWQGYMKGALPFRGVPMASIRAAVHAWWRDEGLAGLAEAAQKQLAFALFEGPFGEDKLAGTLVLHERLLAALTAEDLGTIGDLFARGRVADWNSCDWLCVKVLGALVARELPSRAMSDVVAAWRDAGTVWQRRAANVAFVNLARRGEDNFPGFTSLMLETCAVTVRSDARFAQTGVGWLLRELAEWDRAAVLGFIREHVALMSREGVRYAVERMPKNVQTATYDAHKACSSRGRRKTSTRAAGRAADGASRGGMTPG